jgi:DNA-binding transcriptional LysR family regulator
MDRFSAIEAFVRVAETHSFSEGARKLGKSKSLISRQVAALETELGVRLFQRTTRSITLTEAGRGFFERATRILSDVEDATLSVSRLQASPRGCLRINAPMSFSFLHLAPALPDFLARYPEIEVDLVMNDRKVDLIDEGFDMAVRIGRLTDSSLIARRLSPIRIAVCASPAYLEQYGEPQTPEDLVHHRCLIMPSIEWRFVHPDGSLWQVPVTGPLRANNGDALKAAVLKDLGLCMLPTFIAGNDIQAGKLVCVLNDFMPQDVALYAVYPHSRLLSPKVRAFIDFLSERFGPRPYWDLVE